MAVYCHVGPKQQKEREKSYTYPAPRLIQVRERERRVDLWRTAHLHRSGSEREREREREREVLHLWECREQHVSPLSPPSAARHPATRAPAALPAPRLLPTAAPAPRRRLGPAPAPAPTRRPRLDPGDPGESGDPAIWERARAALGARRRPPVHVRDAAVRGWRWACGWWGRDAARAERGTARGAVRMAACLLCMAAPRHGCEGIACGARPMCWRPRGLIDTANGQPLSL